MHLLPLTFKVLVIFQLREGLADSVYWDGFTGDLSGVDDGYKTHYPVTSLVLCAALAAAKSSCVYCITGTSCVVVSTEAGKVDNSISVGAAQCYKKRDHCCPPFLNVLGVGCIFVNTDARVDFYAARTSCPAKSRLWYPMNSTHAENLRKYLLEDPKAMRLWIDLEKTSGQWTYGDGRVEDAGYEELPWGPDRPRTDMSGYDFACMSYWPAGQRFYHFANAESTYPSSYICDMSHGQ